MISRSGAWRSEITFSNYSFSDLEILQFCLSSSSSSFFIFLHSIFYNWTIFHDYGSLKPQLIQGLKNFNSNLRSWSKLCKIGSVFFSSSLLLLQFIDFDYLDHHSVIKVDVWWILDWLARVNQELEKNYITRSSFVG